MLVVAKRCKREKQDGGDDEREGGGRKGKQDRKERWWKREKRTADRMGAEKELFCFLLESLVPSPKQIT